MSDEIQLQCYPFLPKKWETVPAVGIFFGPPPKLGNQKLCERTVGWMITLKLRVSVHCWKCCISDHLLILCESMVLLTQIAYEILWASAFASEWCYFSFLNYSFLCWQFGIDWVAISRTLIQKNPGALHRITKTILWNSFNTES